MLNAGGEFNKLQVDQALANKQLEASYRQGISTFAYYDNELSEAKVGEELNNFKNLVKEINEESIKYFKYSDYIFDFSNYNPKSIEALLKNIKYIEVSLVLPLAA